MSITACCLRRHASPVVSLLSSSNMLRLLAADRISGGGFRGVLTALALPAFPLSVMPLPATLTALTYIPSAFSPFSLLFAAVRHVSLSCARCSVNRGTAFCSGLCAYAGSVRCAAMAPRVTCWRLRAFKASMLLAAAGTARSRGLKRVALHPLPAPLPARRAGARAALRCSMPALLALRRCRRHAASLSPVRLTAFAPFPCDGACGTARQVDCATALLRYRRRGNWRG